MDGNDDLQDELGDSKSAEEGGHPFRGAVEAEDALAEGEVGKGCRAEGAMPASASALLRWRV